MRHSPFRRFYGDPHVLGVFNFRSSEQRYNAVKKIFFFSDEKVYFLIGVVRLSTVSLKKIVQMSILNTQ